MHIASAEFYSSAPDLASCPDEALPEFAFIGRSNVGKSSLINCLTSRKGLALVSKTPGAFRQQPPQGMLALTRACLRPRRRQDADHQPLQGGER